MKKDGSEFYASTLLTAIHNDDTDTIVGFTSVIQLLSDSGRTARAEKNSA